MATSMKEQLGAARAEINRLTIKLQAQIAQANRYYERLKIAERENQALREALENAGLRSPPAVMQITQMREHFQTLAKELGMKNVRIKGGVLEIQRDGDWVTA